MPAGLHATYSPIHSIGQPQGSRNKWPFQEAWYNIKAQDYAIREGAYMAMAQKLTEYLQFVVGLQVTSMLQSLYSVDEFLRQPLTIV
jgi:hypothetical protein